MRRAGPIVMAVAAALACLLSRGPVVALADECPSGGSHAYGVTIERQPTEDADGAELFVCRKCGRSFERAIPHTGHDWGGWDVAVEPTCVSTGYEQRTCAKCGRVEYRRLDALSSTGEHSWELGDRQGPTSTEDGWESYVCSVCGAARRVVLPAEGAASAESPATSGPEVADAPSAAVGGPATEADATPSAEGRVDPDESAFWSLAPNGLDAVLAVGDLASVGALGVLTVLLLPALRWIDVRRREALLLRDERLASHEALARSRDDGGMR